MCVAHAAIITLDVNTAWFYMRCHLTTSMLNRWKRTSFSVRACSFSLAHEVSTCTTF